MGIETAQEQQYYIVQTFPQKSPVSVSTGSTGPLIIRVLDAAVGADVLAQAVGKLLQDQQQVPPACLEISNWSLVPAKGDGLPDEKCAAVVMDTPLRDQGLSFPYMLSLCWLGERKKQQEPQPATVPVAPRTEGADSPRQNSPELARQESRQQARQNIKEYIKEKQRQLDSINAKRAANVAKTVQNRMERERQHLEMCERREMARRQRVEKERLELEQREKQEIEALQRRELEAQIAKERRQQEENRLLAQVREEAQREAKARAEAAALQDKERQLRLQRDRARRQEEQEQRRKEMEAGREERMLNSLKKVLSKLDSQVAADAAACEAAVQREREERTRADKERFERNYVQRLEKERAAAKERDRHLRLLQEQRQKAKLQKIRKVEEERAARAKQMEEEAFEAWRKKRLLMVEEEKAVQEQLSIIHRKGQKLASSGLPLVA